MLLFCSLLFFLTFPFISSFANHHCHLCAIFNGSATLSLFLSCVVTTTTAAMSSPGSDSSGSFISTKSRGEDDGGGRVVTFRHHFAPDVEPYRSSEDEDEDSAAAAAAADDDDSEDRFDDAASLPSETGTVELSSDVEVEAEELGGGGGKARRAPPAAAADDDDVSEVNGEHGHDEEEDEDGDDEDTTNQDEEEEGELNEPGPMDDGTYTVERIVSKRLNPETDVLEYEVKWVGWPADTNTFEPVAHLLGSEHKIKEFEERRRRLAAKRREKERLLLRKRAAAAGRPRRSASASNSAASSDAEAGEAGVAEEDSGAERAPPQEEEEEEENARRKAAIARERLELISSAERRIVAVRAISLGCRMRGTRDTFDVVFDDKRCTLLADYELELLSEANRRFLNAYYARRIEEIAELKERAYRENLRLAYSLMPADFPRPDDL